MNKNKKQIIEILIKDTDLLNFKQMIIVLVYKFWNEVVINYNSDQFFMVQLHVYIDNVGYRTISYVQTINNKDLKLLIKKFLNFWYLKLSNYQLKDILKLSISYRILPLDGNITQSKLNEHKNIMSEKIKSFKIGNFDLPSTLDFTKWGDTTFYDDFTKAIVYKLNSDIIYDITINSDHTLIDLKINNNIVLTFKDVMIDNNDLSNFKRITKDHEYIFDNSKIVFKKITRKVNFIKPIKPSINLNTNYLVMDFETRTIKIDSANEKVDREMEVFCFSIYDGNYTRYYYLTQFNNSKEMVIEGLLSILKRKYKGYRIFFHNFSNFDLVFLINILVELCGIDNIKPTINNDEYIQIKITYNKYNFIFRDSYLLQPISLEKLAINYNTETKDIYPYEFVNDPNINLDYIGKVPDFKYFVDITLEQYNEYCKEFNDKEWNLKDETIKYCNRDTKVLYEILNKFINFIFDEIRLNVLNYSTLPSLALAIYWYKFLNDHKIPIITGQMYHDMKKGYTGGSVDVFNTYGENLYHYDINSLYPYIMKTYNMPIGNPILFEGNILNHENKPFGIFEAEIITPKELNIPILQTKIKSNNETKTVTPLDKWTGIYLSEELYKAMELGYKINILRGYYFETENIFEEFVNYFYLINY